MIHNSLVPYHQTADYRSWEPVMDEVTRLVYRGYADPVTIQCNIAVSQIGQVSLFSPVKLKSFGVIRDIKDSRGNPVMEGDDEDDSAWYQIQKITPVFDASGAITSYKNVLAQTTPQLIRQPIDPPQPWPDIDQQQWWR